MQMRKVEHCAQTGIALPPSALLRFVLSPEGRVTFDRRQDLPGKAIWLVPKREVVEAAPFADLGEGTQIPADLARQVETQLRQGLLGLLNLIRRSGALIAGFEKVKAAVVSGKAQALVQAADASKDGKAKLAKLAAHHRVPVVECCSRAELAQVTAQENQAHAALLRSGLTEKFLAESALLASYLDLPEEKGSAVL